jgi:hypothetical protein
VNLCKFLIFIGVLRRFTNFLIKKTLLMEDKIFDIGVGGITYKFRGKEEKETNPPPGDDDNNSLLREIVKREGFHRIDNGTFFG